MIVYVVYSVVYPYLPMDVCDSLRDVAERHDVDYRNLKNCINQLDHVYNCTFTVRKVYISD